MINYFLAGVWTALAVVTVVTDYQVNSMLSFILMLSVAALIAAARWQEDRYNKTIESCKAAHPSAWPKTTEPYDWFKDQEGTE